MSNLEHGLRAVVLGVIANLSLAVIKIVTGVVGNSYALIADGIESTADVVSSLVVWAGLRIASQPADEDHPYGHGKAESIAAVIAALGLLTAAVIIAVQSVHEIQHPHNAPEWYTLVVLVVVIAVKEFLARRVLTAADALESTSLKVDAWHHRSDALTSAAVAVGIAVALWGGPGFEAADDWAALIACAVIAINGLILLRFAVREIMDETVPAETQQKIREIAVIVDGVQIIEKVRVRKSGLGLHMDIHVQVDAQLTVREGHAIGHRVKDSLMNSGLRIDDVVVHIEPAGDDD